MEDGVQFEQRDPIIQLVLERIYRDKNAKIVLTLPGILVQI